MTSSKLSKSLSKVVFLYASSSATQMRNKVLFLHEHSMVVSVVQQMAVLSSLVASIHSSVVGSIAMLVRLTLYLAVILGKNQSL